MSVSMAGTVDFSCQPLPPPSLVLHCKLKHRNELMRTVQDFLGLVDKMVQIQITACIDRLPRES